MRQTTATIDGFLALSGGERCVAFDISIPSGAYPITLHVAEYPVAFGAYQYTASIKDRGNITHAEGASLDGTSVAIRNNNETFGVALAQGDRSLEGATVTVYMVFKTSAGYEARTLGLCVVDGVSVDVEAVRLTLTTDLARREIRVGGEMLSQRCIYVFNVGGLTYVDPVDGQTYGTVGKRCAWALAQGGDSNFCDLTLSGEKGCISHNNLHHIGAVPELDEVTRQIATGGDDGGGLLPGTIPRPGDDGGYPDPNDPRTGRGRHGMDIPFTRDLNY